MPEYADFIPVPGLRLPRLELLIRPAAAEDIPQLAALAAQREGLEPEKFIKSFTAEVAGDQSKGQLFVALSDGHMAGYARIWHYQGDETVKWPSPLGWYARGLTVAPELRRRGVASALAAFRWNWLLARGANSLYSFINAGNHSSLQFHTSQGFYEVGRAAGYLNASFEGGQGLLLLRSV